MKTTMITEFEDGDIVIHMKYINAFIRWTPFGGGDAVWQCTNGARDIGDDEMRMRLSTDSDYEYIGNRVNDFGARPWQS